MFASPVGAAGRAYVTGRDGTTVVLSDEARIQVLAVNQLEDGFSASPATVDRELYLRGEKFLLVRLVSPIEEVPRLLAMKAVL